MAWIYKGECPSGRLFIGDSEYKVGKGGIISPDLSDEHKAVAAQSRLFEEKFVQIEKEASQPKQKRSAKKKSPSKK